jgi:hypothetical protein
MQIIVLELVNILIAHLLTVTRPQSHILNITLQSAFNNVHFGPSHFSSLKNPSSIECDICFIFSYTLTCFCLY